MKTYRHFWLENQDGRVLKLTGEGSNMFLSDPTGLGFSFGTTYSDIGGGFYQASETKKEPQTPISGTMNFYGPRPYDEYKYFADFVLNATELIIGYMPGGPNPTHYRRRVKLSEIQKGERSRNGILSCAISMDPVSPWYSQNEMAIKLSNPGDGFWIMGTSILNEDKLTEDAGKILRATLKAEGQLPSAFLFTYNGALESPTLVLLGTQSGIIYGGCQLDVTIYESEALIYSTEPGNSYIRRRQSYGKETDLLDSANMDMDIYPTVPTTEKCVLQLTASNMSGYGSVVMKHYMKGV